MAEHHELVAEMLVLEQMGTQERQKLAKKRRLQQLKKWGQREKEWIAKEKQLNKRLANKLLEENNGLNLKQYTTYSSNHRSKKKIQLTANNTNGDSLEVNDFLNNNNNSIDIDPLGRNFRVSDKPKANLTPHGRVHFNVGVMLLEAAARNDINEVKRLLILGVSPDSVNHDGLTALHQCCIDASEPIMNLLLEFGANVDARDTEHWTPLHAACTCGHLNLVKILVEHGADLLAINGDCNMPFDICEDEATLDYIESQMVKRGITQEMIDFTRASPEMQMISDLEKQVNEGKNLNAANETGVTALHIAAANGYFSVVKFLIEHGVNVNVCDNDLWRPIHGAACWGNEQHSRIVELLVEAGACLDAKTANDETVFDLCDNADLLEKLNQLKDELESKQTTGTDRLKRTQSRTNSRVHSVRRTKVRDKNQISRREAREEALLRVENSPKEGTTPEISQSLPANFSMDGTETHSDASSSSNELKTNGIGESKDQVDSLQDIKASSSGNSKLGNHVEPYNQAATSESLGSNLNGNTKSTGNSACSSNESLANKRKQLVKQTKVGNEMQDGIISSAEVSRDFEKKDRLVNGKNNSKFNLQMNMTTTDMKDKTTSNKSTIVSIKNQDKQTELDAHNSLDTACDVNFNRIQTELQINSQQPLVQMVPINYTLSNLKKQRSDLRMRTTSIGGGSTNGSSTANSNPQSRNKTVVDLKATNANGLNRPESPNLAFRKFSGEPSEVIGGFERNRRHKCCILI